jgi:hypothetical protein
MQEFVFCLSFFKQAGNGGSFDFAKRKRFFIFIFPEDKTKHERTVFLSLAELQTWEDLGMIIAKGSIALPYIIYFDYVIYVITLLRY